MNDFNFTAEEIMAEMQQHEDQRAKAKKHFFEHLDPALKDLPRECVEHIYDLGYSHGHQSGFSKGLEKAIR
jgi:hypothetical protein